MRSTTILIASTIAVGTLAADDVVTLNLPTDIASSLTAVELISSPSPSATTFSFPCDETNALCEGGVTLIVEPSAYTMLAPLADDVVYTAACDVDTSASTDSCSMRTGTDDTWLGIGTDNITQTAVTITVTATPVSNTASTTILSTAVAKTQTISSASSTDTKTANSSSSNISTSVETTDNDDAAIAMMTAAPWAGAVVAGLAAAVVMA